ncbi:FtsX-like permease family protein [Thermoclostridium caenicola]|uniref:FtsX-like permease family protein n=1 Tax=Thermoclostridium caenicola TaxID=659425 RepID=UPI002D1F9D85|nr:FtsX-like permease family protein [Thermoclostridium caenicola]
MTTALYLAGAAVALLLTAYLYIGRQKKAYAIMRALGTPRRKARNALALPLAVLSAVAIPAGGITGMVYASRTLSSALADLAAVMEHYTPDASLPAGAMVLCLFGEILVLFGLSALFMRKLAKTPPLALLQGDAARNRRERARKKALQAMVAESSPIPQFTLSFPISRELPKGGDYSPVKHVFRYVLRHMGRAGWRTVMAVLLAFLLTGAMGLLAVTRLSYQELFEKTEVKGTLINYSSRAVMEASESELMEDFYYSGGYWVILNDIPAENGSMLVVTNDINPLK